MNQKVFQKRIDQELYDNVSAIYEELGTPIGEAFVMFLKKTMVVGGLPFELTLSDKAKRNKIIHDLALEKSPIKEIDWDDPKQVEDLCKDW